MSTENIPAFPETPPLPEAGQAANLGSPISDLSYRSYSGPLKTRYLRWWVVAQSGLKQTFSQPLLYVLLGLPTLRFMVAAAQLYFTSNFAPNFPNFMGEPEGQKYADIFWSAMCGDFNALITVLIAVAVGAGSISADNRSNALLVYLAKTDRKGGLSIREVAKHFFNSPCLSIRSRLFSLLVLRFQLSGRRIFYQRTLARPEAVVGNFDTGNDSL